jgi:small subunit ribosomal protein S17
MSSETKQGTRRTRVGVVISNKMQKTVVVEVDRRTQHARYVKFVGKRVRYKAHDETNACGIGDRVLIEETRPLSKDKRWRVKEIVERATAL